ncbi:MAG: cell division protein ZapA [Rhodobacter sp.]|nr:cell division protein ZapA [Rhodobacter sp.]
MPEVTVTIGGREFSVSCQEGEEHYLQTAAAMLDTEASAITAQIGRLPEPRMLLMSGLMLADKTAGMEEQLVAAKERIAALEAEASQMPAPEPERVEVPVIPQIVTDSFAELAARAEALAAKVEEKASA